MAIRTITSIWQSRRSRWIESVMWYRLAITVVTNHTHQEPAKTSAIQAYPVSGLLCDAAELRIRIAATNARS